MLYLKMSFIECVYYCYTCCVNYSYLFLYGMFWVYSLNSTDINCAHLFKNVFIYLLFDMNISYLLCYTLKCSTSWLIVLFLKSETYQRENMKIWKCLLIYFKCRKKKLPFNKKNQRSLLISLKWFIEFITDK